MVSPEEISRDESRWTYLEPRDRKEEAMKTTIRNTLGTLLFLAPSTFAAGTTGGGEAGFAVSLLLAIFAVMIAFQLVPATMMMIGIVRGFVGRVVDLPR